MRSRRRRQTLATKRGYQQRPLRRKTKDERRLRSILAKLSLVPDWATLQYAGVITRSVVTEKRRCCPCVWWANVGESTIRRSRERVSEKRAGAPPADTARGGSGRGGWRRRFNFNCVQVHEMTRNKRWKQSTPTCGARGRLARLRSVAGPLLHRRYDRQPHFYSLCL